MANRYWVGGTAAWDGTAGSKWSDTSGGSGGFSVPTTADDVFFTNLSTGTCTISTGNTGAKSITCTGFTGTLAGNAAITVAGGIALVAGMTYTSTSPITLTGTGTLTTAGKTLRNVTINGVGITVTLGDALLINTANTLTLTAGTFDANNQNVSAGGVLSSNSNTRTFTMGSGTYTVGSTWNFATTTGLTFSGASSTINLSSVSFAFTGGGLTYGTVNFTSTAIVNPSISGANTFSTLSFAARGASGIGFLTLSANQTVTTSFSVQSGATDPTRRLFIRSDVEGTARTITSASNTIFGADFRDITGAGVASWDDSGRTGYWGDCKGNSGITFSAGQTVYWNLAGAQNWSATGWALTSTGTPAAANFPLPQDTATFTDAGSVTGTITINFPWSIGTLDMSNRTSAMTLATVSTTYTLYGNWLNGSGTTLTGTGTLTFGGRNTQSITSASKTFTQAVTINSVGGTVQLVDALTLGSTLTLTLTAGTFNASNQNVTVGAFSSSNSNTRTLTMGSGTWTLSGTGNVWTTTNTTNLTFNANTSTIVLSDTSTTARFFNGGGLTYNNLTIGGATGTSILTINSINTFNTISSTKTVAHTITFSAAQTVNNWTVTGTAGNVVTVNSSTVGTQRTLTYTGSGTISMDYMSITNINFSYTLGAANPYLVYAGANSTNGGNNNGVAFIDGTTQKAYRLTTGTTWTVPVDWNNSNNTIHMIGAGGGGATSAASGNNRAAGGGGGGGGYTVLTNQTLSGAIPYTIGTSAGNTNGGSTTFNTTNIAGGGLVGTATTVPLSTGGLGGTGVTFNGGNGGAGSFGTAASTGYGGGGGGGAGGVNGAGGNGGSGFGSSTTVNIASGGGGGNGGGSNGGNAASATFGAGGNNFNGVGGGVTAAAVGTLGGGGAGNTSTNSGGVGGSGIDISNTIGGGGGKGGNGTLVTGLYGGGGSGNAVTTGGGGAGGTGAAGSQGVIFIIYTPGGAPVSNSNFFLMFG